MPESTHHLRSFLSGRLGASAQRSHWAWILASASGILAHSLHAQPPAFQHPPKLVVGIVVDQMRADYLYRYWSNFGEGGFKRLALKGAFLRDAHFDHIPTETGPGHASVYTGTTPARRCVSSRRRSGRFGRGHAGRPRRPFRRHAPRAGSQPGPYAAQPWGQLLAGGTVVLSERIHSWFSFPAST